MCGNENICDCKSIAKYVGTCYNECIKYVL